MAGKKINIKAIARSLIKTKRKLPTQLGNIMVKHFKRSFRLGGFEGSRFKKWKPRKDHPLNTRSRGRRKRALLVESGALRNSIRLRSASWNIIRVGSYDTEYARVHNRGQVTRPKVTAKMRKWAWANFKKTGDQAFLRLNRTPKKRLEVPHPARPFIQRSAMMNAKLKKRIRKSIKNVFIQ